MTRKIPAWIWWLPALLWMGLIFFMSHQQGGGSGRLSRMILEWFASFGLDLRVLFGENAFWVIRKMAHFTEYFILFLLVNLALRQYWEWKKRRWRVLLVCFLYAASDEFHQLFIPGRVGDVLDVTIDTLGASTAMLLLGWRHRRQGHSAASQAR